MTIPENQPSAHPYRTAFEPLDSDRLRVPYNDQTRMRLALSSGLADARIVIDPAAQDLIAIRCGDGIKPWLRVADGEIALTWRGSFGDWLRDAFRPSSRDVAITLHPAVEWTLAIRGGLAHSELDLSAGTLARLDISGGCSDVQLDLPVPKANVPIRITGGASGIVVRRSPDTGVALAASGGMAELRLDEQYFGAIGGSARLETRTVVAGAPCYELQLAGGAADITIERR